MPRLRYISLCLTVLGMAGCAGTAQRQFVSQVMNKPAPDFELTALDGAKVRLSDQRGKPVLVAFFAYS